MALETLKGVEKIGGFEVKRVNWNMPPGHFVEVCDLANAITFKIQNGPIKEVGVNGCQVDTIIAAAKEILSGLNDKFPCPENEQAIRHLGEALTELENRRLNRESRGVEGFGVA